MTLLRPTPPSLVRADRNRPAHGQVQGCLPHRAVRSVGHLVRSAGSLGASIVAILALAAHPAHASSPLQESAPTATQPPPQGAAVTDQAGADQATTDQASADKAAADKAKKEQEEAEAKDPTKLTSAKFSALAARPIGPALTSGRIGDIAVNPRNTAEWYIAACSGGIWKTTNAGTTFQPIFDSYGAFSIGCVTLDPSTPSTVWVGTGENNSQRSVSFGDGVYVSRDAGQSFANVGLKDSMHIGMIKVDPRNSSVVYVAAMGNLWADSAERGIYKTTDAGKTWERILHVSDMTGCSEIHLDPRNPDVLYATAYQRRRHVWTLINGGPECAIYKSTDAGKTWNKLEGGIPGADKGRIGLAIPPAKPDTLYAIIEAAEGAGGLFRSQDAGASWSKQSGFMTTSPQYYNELFADPVNPDRYYIEDTFLAVTNDGGKTTSPVSIADTHVDFHAVWIDPANTDHLLVGNDGGLYESFDREHWRHFENLPVTQFYRVGIDNSEPFYFVYGGTQDNNTLGGPSRTTDRAGITNADWFNTVGGDGFEAVVDPTDPNTVYCEWQEGGLSRFDRRSGETIDIRPREQTGDAPYFFNWDTPLILSPHNPKRIYYAGNFLFRSDDRGNSWSRISEDLSRGLDRNQLKVMGVVQKPEAVAKNMSTSFFGAGISISESPVQEGLLYVGTDDGLVHVREGDGWRKIETIPGVPEMSYVSCVEASRHDASRVYATFDNHKMGDLKPYVFRSDDKGLTWRSISGDLPDRAVAYVIREDHENQSLLFAGTEGGAFFTLDGGEKWFKVPGLPTIAVRDIELQRRENDLVLATFGRGFYILDDYSPLRTISSELFAKDAYIFPLRTARAYVERSRIGGGTGRGWAGAAMYNTPNPPFGATCTYYIKEKLTTLKERRKEAQKKDTWQYPTLDAFRAEDAEPTPEVVILVRDAAGTIIRQLEASRDAGLHRATWDLRYPSVNPAGEHASGGEEEGEGGPPIEGALALPGTYTMQLCALDRGTLRELAPAQSFEVRDLPQGTFTVTGTEREAKFKFEREVANLHRAVQGAQRTLGEATRRVSLLQPAIEATPGADRALIARVEALRLRCRELAVRLSGDPTMSSRLVPQLPSISERVATAFGDNLTSTQPPTITHQQQLSLASSDFTTFLKDLAQLVEADLPALEKTLDAAKAPWTPGRMPTWEPGGK